MLEEQRIEWSTAPNQLTVTSPFLVSLLQDSVEVHDIYTLSSLQRIKFVAPSIPLSLYLCDNVSVSTNTSVIRIPCCYVLTSDSINILTLIPLSVQVSTFYRFVTLQYMTHSFIYMIVFVVLFVCIYLVGNPPGGIRKFRRSISIMWILSS